ncbi:MULTISPECIES: hypothetical protein [unclassified Solwaraspora]|uniref:hypothetical protein n=1 Tax=unclassified Solwaraspora TaxID=2627926 RepID=UPI00259BD851|nr:hypothetical protein [Solwaraspora sp. WMMA2056]WJK43346.1 hypothetical protein O7608_13635 [Solwaraspora sp. WMMA2056]
MVKPSGNAAGRPGPAVDLDVGGGQLVGRTVDEVPAAVFALPSSAPHLFGGRLIRRRA